jgi:hypothetical protein
LEFNKRPSKKRRNELISEAEEARKELARRGYSSDNIKAVEMGYAGVPLPEKLTPAPVTEQAAPAEAPAPEVAPARLYLNVPFNRKQRNMMVDICLDALELVEEADVPTVTRTMLKMASTRVKVKQSFKAIRSCREPKKISTHRAPATAVLWQMAR